MSLKANIADILKKLVHDKEYMLDSIYSLLMNFRMFPFSIAIKKPILFRHDVKVIGCNKGSILLTDPIKKHMIKIGFPGALTASVENSVIFCDSESKIVLGDNVALAQGVKLLIANGGCLEIGDNFYSNANLSIQCEKNIHIGNNVLVGWDCKIRDTDGHQIIENGVAKNIKKSINIDDDVWLASDITILKGSEIPSGSVVACGSMVCGLKSDISNCLIAGIPAKEIKRNIEWRK
jgi:acetyltransferase-like isoleucine patch superfamily enzyme